MASNLAKYGEQDQMENLDRTMKAKIKRRLRLELEVNGIGNQKALAIATNTDEGALSRMLSAKCEDTFPLHKLPAQVLEHGPGLMEYVALQCGGVYHHGETLPAIPDDPLSLAGLIAIQAGKSVQQIIQDARSDNEWTALERQDAIPGLRKLIAVATSLLQEAEGGKP